MRQVQCRTARSGQQKPSPVLPDERCLLRVQYSLKAVRKSGSPRAQGTAAVYKNAAAATAAKAVVAAAYHSLFSLRLKGVQLQGRRRGRRLEGVEELCRHAAVRAGVEDVAQSVGKTTITVLRGGRTCELLRKENRHGRSGTRGGEQGS
jgi:hypothetical protein